MGLVNLGLISMHLDGWQTSSGYMLYRISERGRVSSAVERSECPLVGGGGSSNK